MTFRAKIRLSALVAVLASVGATTGLTLAFAGESASRPAVAAVIAVAGLAAGAITILIVSTPWNRRLRVLEDRAVNYARGDLPATMPDFAQDEIGAVSRMLDALTHDVAGRIASLEADRARMAAILSGML